jgi:hypothetical protein
LRAGDEFWWTEKEPLGLLTVSRAEQDFAYAEVVFARRAPLSGDRIAPQVRWGLEVQAGLSAVLPDAGTGTGGGFFIVPELRFVPARGFYKYRPLGGLRALVDPSGKSAGGSAPPWGLFAGGELNWYFGRFVLTPTLTGGINFETASGGGIHSFEATVEIKAAYLIDPRFRLSARGGLALFKTADSAAPDLELSAGPGRVILGLGVDFKL